MTDYKARVIRAIYVPADPQEVIGEPEEKSIQDWLTLADIQWMNIVNASSKLNLVMVVDDDGHSRGLPYNPRAQFLSSYPIDHPIVGNVFFASVDFIDDGQDLVHIKDDSAAWVKNPQRSSDYQAWCDLYRDILRFRRVDLR